MVGGYRKVPLEAKGLMAAILWASCLTKPTHYGILDVPHLSRTPMSERSPEREFASEIEQKLVEHIEGDAEIQDIIQRLEGGEMTREDLLQFVERWNAKNYTEIKGMYADKTFSSHNSGDLRILMDEQEHMEMRT